MLKLIATDMDGTLLNDKKEMPRKTFEIINRLDEKGITFAVASGRQHLSLQKLYHEIKDDIVIVAGNGSIIIDKGEVIFANTMNPEDVHEIVVAVSKLPNLKMTICGLKAAYMFEDNLIKELSPTLVESHFPTHLVIGSLDDLPADEKVIQIAVFDPQFNAKENIYEQLASFKDRCQMAISGPQWTDIMNLGVNKGAAIKRLQEKLGAAAEETMVFGDELNDYEMMQQAYYSYAMANAVPQIKEISNFMAPSNEEQGVIRILENFLAMTE